MLPHVYFHTCNSTPLPVTKFICKISFFENKGLPGQLVKSNFAPIQDESQTFSSHNQASKNIDTIM